MRMSRTQLLFNNGFNTSCSSNFLGSFSGLVGESETMAKIVREWWKSSLLE